MSLVAPSSGAIWLVALDAEMVMECEGAAAQEGALLLLWDPQAGLNLLGWVCPITLHTCLCQRLLFRECILWANIVRIRTIALRVFTLLLLQILRAQRLLSLVRNIITLRLNRRISGVKQKERKFSLLPLMDDLRLQWIGWRIEARVWTLKMS